jgi:hypothetical protein
MNAQIVLVDGIPGSGKSVVAQTIKRRMREADQHVRWWYEEELDHAIYLFRDAATLHRVTDDLFSGAHEGVIAAALEKWASFAQEAVHTRTSVVADGAFFGYLTWTLHYLDRPEAEARAYVRGVQDALASLRPRLIYLRQRDVTATMRNLLAVRGPGWAEGTIRKAVESPYGRARGLNRVDGFEGLTRFWSDFQALEERLFDDARIAKLAVDVAVGSWTPVEASIGAWLDLPTVQAIDPGNLGRFVGAYRATDGSVAHVEQAGGSLRIRGLHQVWPGQRMIPLGGDAFEVLSLPFTIRFEGPAMLVEGPELLGGRPPARLDRLPS